MMTRFLAPGAIPSICVITTTNMMFDKAFWSRCRFFSTATKWTYSVRGSRWS